jgi:hypothetical protein
MHERLARLGEVLATVYRSAHFAQTTGSGVGVARAVKETSRDLARPQRAAMMGRVVALIEHHLERISEAWHEHCGND